MTTHSIWVGGPHWSLALALTCASCGNISAEEPDGGIAEDADPPSYPFVDGARWTYEIADGANAPWLHEVTLGLQEVAGATVMLLENSPKPNGTRSQSILEQEGTAVHRVKKVRFGPDGSVRTTVDYDPGFIRFDDAWADAEVGDEFVVEFERTERASASQAVEVRQYLFTVELIDQTRTVEAGRFESCTRVRKERYEPSSSGQVSVRRFVFCPGVGKVLKEDLTDGVREELVSCHVPGGRCPPEQE